MPRGLTTEKPGFFGLRGEQWKLRPAFFTHPDYAGYAEKVFENKMGRPQLLHQIREALAGRRRPCAEVRAYVEWEAPRCLGVTRNVSPAQHLRWMVHNVLMADTPFDDEVELFEKGVQVAARNAQRKGEAVLSGDPVSMLRRFLMEDLRFWSIGYRKMWKVLAEANVALKELVDDTWWRENEHRVYLPVLEDNLDKEHVAKYKKLIETIEKRHHNVLEGVRTQNALARALGAEASEDGHLVRANEQVHGFKQTEESWREHLEAYNILAGRLRRAAESRVRPWAECLSRDGPHVIRTYVNPVAIYGPAGAGKTHLTIALMLLCDDVGLNWELTSLTANPSVRMGGVHVHQFFRMCRADEKCPAPRIAQLAANRIRSVPVLRRYLQDLDVLFIDELCTLSATTLTAMEMILGKVRCSTQPFRNLKVICTVDHHQLPPIGGRGQDESARSLLVRALFSSIKLTALVRCRCPLLEEVQRLMRIPTPKQADVDRIDALLQEHCHVGEQPPEDVIYLFAHKETVRKRCEDVAASIPAHETETFKAVDQELKWFQGAKLRNNEGIHHALDKYTTMARELVVWKGMQVMLRGINPNPSIGLVNCALGKVVGFSKGDVERPWVEVKFDQPVDIPQPVRLHRKESEPVLGPGGLPISRLQIPLVHAVVWTMHMGQRMTL